MKEKGEMGKKRYIVRTYSAGVFFGEIEERNGKEVKMKNVRRLHYWSGAASLSQLAVDGVCRPEKCQFPASVHEITVTEAIEILSVTPKAEISIDNVPIWEIKK